MSRVSKGRIARAEKPVVGKYRPITPTSKYTPHQGKKEIARRARDI